MCRLHGTTTAGTARFATIPCQIRIAYPYRLRPDFSWETDGGELILWEHLGMLDREDYKKG